MESVDRQDRVAQAVEALAASAVGPGDRFLVFEATDGAGRYGYVFLRLRDGVVHLHPVEATAINPVPLVPFSLCSVRGNTPTGEDETQT